MYDLPSPPSKPGRTTGRRDLLYRGVGCRTTLPAAGGCPGGFPAARSPCAVRLGSAPGRSRAHPGHRSGTVPLPSRSCSAIPIARPGSRAGRLRRAAGSLQPGVGLLPSHPAGRAGNARGRPEPSANFAGSCHIPTYIYIYMHISDRCNNHNLIAHKREKQMLPHPPSAQK